jgi:hypothetical protein
MFKLLKFNCEARFIEWLFKSKYDRIDYFMERIFIISNECKFTQFPIR